MQIPFNKPFLGVEEKQNINEVFNNGKFSGDGVFTKIASKKLEKLTGAKKVLLTHSGTAALEMAALLIDLKEGDEVILPSYTFVTSASSFVLRGATPVYVDIELRDLNIDTSTIEKAITKKTKAIIVVHYAGKAVNMDAVMKIANSYDLIVIEDAAQAINSSYKGSQLGTIGHFGTYSFHETKNLISGEGGAILINDEKYIARAEMIREKGTNRSQFLRGEIDKYTWRELGSSYLPSELNAAVLSAQIDKIHFITDQRRAVCKKYETKLRSLIGNGLISISSQSDYGKTNGHIFYTLLDGSVDRELILKDLKDRGINAVSHYEPLHLSPYGKKIGRASGGLENTCFAASNIVRLPVWVGMEDSEIAYVCETLKELILR